MATRAKQTAAKSMMEISEPFKRLIPDRSGESLEEQIFPWNVEGMKKNLNQPTELHKADPTTVTNILQMAAVELQHWAAYNASAKYVTDKTMKDMFISLARAEEIHHLKLLSLLPKMHDASEMVLTSEVALLSMYSDCIDNESDPAVSEAFFYVFNDHLTHAEYAAGIVQKMGCDPGTFTSGADISGGRPLNHQFMKPEDTVWHGKYDGAYDKNRVDPMTLINVDMANAAELAAWEGYSCAMKNTDDQAIRLHYGTFRSIEGQHVAIIDSLKDPTETPLERSLVHEAVEISNYGRKMKYEPDENVRKVFQELYEEDMEQARLLGQWAK